MYLVKKSILNILFRTHLLNTIYYEKHVISVSITKYIKGNCTK